MAIFLLLMSPLLFVKDQPIVAVFLVMGSIFLAHRLGLAGVMIAVPLAALAGWFTAPTNGFIDVVAQASAGLGGGVLGLVAALWAWRVDARWRLIRQMEREQ